MFRNKSAKYEKGLFFCLKIQKPRFNIKPSDNNTSMNTMPFKLLLLIYNTIGITKLHLVW